MGIEVGRVADDVILPETVCEFSTNHFASATLQKSMCD